MKNLSTIACLLVCFLVVGCKKKPIELTGELGQFVGTWECIERNQSVSSTSEYPLQAGFVHDIIIEQNGNYHLNRADNIVEKGCIIDTKNNDNGLFELSWVPRKKDDNHYYKKGSFEMYIFELNNKIMMQIDGSHQPYRYVYEKK